MILHVSPEAPAVLHVAAATLLGLHVGGGAMGMVSGVTAMLAPKGGRLHRLAGTAFFVAMLTMAAIGAGVAPFLSEGRWTNTFAAVFTFYLVATAWATVRRGAGEVGRFEAVALVVPLGLAALGLALVWVGVQSGRVAGFATVYVFAAVAALAAAGDLRMIRRGGLAGAARTARHVWRMSLALFVAMGSFFLGQQQVLPEAVRGTIYPALPVLAVVGLGLFWFVRVRFPGAFRRRPRAASGRMGVAGA